MFQSTRPYGARRYQEVFVLRSGVSIHAPVRGATGLCREDIPTIIGFQSTRPYGARLYASSVYL